MAWEVAVLGSLGELRHALLDTCRLLCDEADASASLASRQPAPCSSWSAALFAALRSLLHRLEHVVISSQSFSHFFLHVNGRWHTTHVFTGRL